MSTTSDTVEPNHDTATIVLAAGLGTRMRSMILRMSSTGQGEPPVQISLRELRSKDSNLGCSTMATSIWTAFPNCCKK